MKIPLKLNKDFERAMARLGEKYGEDFEYLNGFHDTQMNFSDFLDSFIEKNVADVTIDANASASNKDIRSLMNEKGKSLDKVFAFNKIFLELKQKYGLNTAKEWLEGEYSGDFYLHDAPTTTYLPYCYAYDLTRLAEEGLFFLEHYNNKAPKHLTTFMDAVIEYISYMSNRSSGAVGIPNILIWTYYFWKHDCETGYYIKDPDYYIRQNFQKLIYRLNQPFMRIDQTAFVNVSIFDREYLKSLFGGVEYPDGSFVIDQIDEIIEHQKVFMEVVLETRTENLFTFPILTYSLLYKDGKFADEDFARWCSDHNTKWNDSNFFISGDVTTLSNCPLSPDTEVLYKPSEEADVVSETIENLYDIYKDSGKEIIAIQDGKDILCRVNRFKEPANYEIVLENNVRFKTTKGHLNKTRREGTVQNYVRTIDLTKEDLLFCDSRWVKIKEINLIRPESQISYCMEVADENAIPEFTLSNGIVTHNCRLLSDTTKLSGFINSIGGTALSIGSIKVNTINLMRIAIEADGDEGKYLDILKKKTILACKTLEVVRDIIAQNIKRGLLPNYQDGAIEMDKQYNTVGILGLYEAVEAFGYIEEDEFGYKSYSDEGIAFASKVFETINKIKDSFSNDYSINVESVPAERAAVVLCQKDNNLFEIKDKHIYSNQWIPLSEKCTISEKLRLGRILDEKCSGGSISHINLESNFPSTDMAWDMLNKIAESGVIYFAFNTRINECKNHHGFVGTDQCPTCGEPVYDTYVRIVGYLVPTRGFSKGRAEEFSARQWYEYALIFPE